MSGISKKVCSLQQHKFDCRFDPHIFLGYQREFDGYVYFNLISSKMVISKDVIFMEDNFDLNYTISSSQLDSS